MTIKTLYAALKMYNEAIHPYVAYVFSNVEHSLDSILAECPAVFKKTTQLWCRGYCGDDWDLPGGDEGKIGCQKEDAYAYCHLKTCSKDAVATDIKFGAAKSEPGFACDADSITGKGIKNYPGPYFGIHHVKVDMSVKDNHGEGTKDNPGVVRATCTVPGKYDVFLRVIKNYLDQYF